LQYRRSVVLSHILNRRTTTGNLVNSDDTLLTISKKSANSGQVKYSDPVIIRDNSQTRIAIVPNYITHSDGTQELKLKLVTYTKNKQLGFVVNEEKSSPWLDETEARLLLNALNAHMAVTHESQDGNFLVIKIDEGVAQIGAHDPSKVAQALTSVLGQKEIVKHLQNTELSAELMKSFRTVIKLTEMRSAVTELREKLQQGEVSEAVYQDWCEKHTWAFGNAYIIRDNVRSISTGDKLDIILPKVISGYRDIVELKRPDKTVLAWDETHNNYYFASEVSKAIGQCHRYLDVFHEEAAKGLRDHPEVVAYHPRAIIIIGRSNDWSEAKQKALHGLNCRLSNITIMAYDHLLAQGERLLEMLAPRQDTTHDIITEEDEIVF